MSTAPITKILMIIGSVFTWTVKSLREGNLTTISYYPHSEEYMLMVDERYEATKDFEEELNKNGSSDIAEGVVDSFISDLGYHDFTYDEIANLNYKDIKKQFIK